MSEMAEGLPLSDFRIHPLSILEMSVNSLSNFEREVYSSLVAASRLSVSLKSAFEASMAKKVEIFLLSKKDSNGS